MADNQTTRCTDNELIGAVAGLVRVYEAAGQTDACVRLTPAQARRLIELAAQSVEGEGGRHARH